MRPCLRREVAFQKMLHPFDARERSHLYKMNFISVEELAENLMILLDISGTSETGDELVHFLSEDEIYNMITSKDQVPNEDPAAEQDASKRCFKPQEALAVIWDDSDECRYWSIGFFVSEEGDDWIKVDHLKPRNQRRFNEWIRPESDDCQIVNPVQLLPLDVVGE